MDTTCSVKAKGAYRIPPQLEVPNWLLRIFNSSGLSSKKKNLNNEVNIKGCFEMLEGFIQSQKNCIEELVFTLLSTILLVEFTYCTPEFSNE